MSIEKSVEATAAILAGTDERRTLKVYGVSNFPDHPAVLHLTKFGDAVQVSGDRTIGKMVARALRTNPPNAYGILQGLPAKKFWAADEKIDLRD
jgi:hypothetical protein